MVPGSEAFEGYTSEDEAARRREVEQGGGEVDVVDTQEQLYPSGGHEELDDAGPSYAQNGLPLYTNASDEGDQTDPDDEGTRESDPNGHDPVGEPPYERKDISWGDEEALRKMREAPDGAEGELSDGQTWDRAETPDSGFPSADVDDLTPDTLEELSQRMAALLGVSAGSQVEGPLVQAANVGVGRAIDADDEVPMVGIVLSVAADATPIGEDFSVVRAITPLKALQMAARLMDIALSMITDADEDEVDDPEEPASADPDPQSPEKLDTDE